MLDEYRAKRDFLKTAEPAPKPADGLEHTGPLTYVVQKHAARRLHYDFRLEVDGVLKSWPIPNGPSYTHGEKRLAVMTEDHPLDYATFEGLIPKGEYGGGQVIVWDAGIYAPEDKDGGPCFVRERAEALVRDGIKRGKLTVFLHGSKLRGGWTLVHTQEKNWLFLKKDDAFANPGHDVVAEDASVLSGLTIADLQAGRLPPAGRQRALLLGAAEATGARRAALPRGLSPMLPSIADKPFSNPSWLFEPKLDGYRVIATVDQGEVRLSSRRGLDCSNEYPWLVEALKRQPYRDAIFDGEIVALDETGKSSFQLLQNRMSEPRPFLLFYAFDVLYRDGYDLRGVPLEQRKKLLATSLLPGARLRVVDTYAEDGVVLFEAVRAQGMEGVVAKRRDSRYETGKRTDSWLKIKATRSDEFVVGGYTVGSGSRTSTFGSLVVGYYKSGAKKLTYVGHAGSGFDERTLELVFGRLKGLRTAESPFEGVVPTVGRWTRPGKGEGPISWVKPELVAQVKYAEITSDGIMRAPVFLGLREDKAARDVGGVDVVVAAPSEGTTGRVAAANEAERVAEEVAAHTGEKLTVSVDGYDIAFSNLNKVFWPAHGEQRALTKRDLVVFFARAAPYLLPHLKDRPLTLVRFPNGIHGGHFYQKHYEQPLPHFVETVRLWSDHSKGDGVYLLGNNLATLLWLGQVADIELHTWYSRVDTTGDGEGLPRTFAGSLENMQQSALNYPDFVVFDLDPYVYSGKEARGAEPELHPAGFAATCETALWLKEMLDGLGLTSFVKTTGRTGLHIYVPINRTLDYHATHTISETLARFLVQQHPTAVTAEWAVDKRRGKVFADYNQNVRGKTLASIYSPRVLRWAAVSMPLRWDEVGKVFPTDFTILTAPDRLRQVGDLWSGILDSKHDL
ncbi:MAG TPA: non-homologous end-joining DNA ligase, partial [Chloroflexota bacterium]|nr:non-homologous end-joining DNA ligase [Chloroflexota bacterium]